LREPIYQPTATYGHFGNPNYPWEVLDPARIKALQAFTGINRVGR
jgi:S-adenosylmethionine synthetase